MSRTLWNKWLLSATGAAGLLFGQALYGQEIAPLPPGFGAGGDPSVDVLFINDEAPADEKDNEEASKTEFWLGLGLDGYLPEIVKHQLGLEHGLVVSDVVPNSPAAKAELKKDDILIKAERATLKEPQDLVKVVDASDGKEIAITVVRGAKEITVKITPTKRPETDAKTYRLRVPSGKFGPEIKGLEDALAKLKGKAGSDSLGLFFARPGVMAPSINVFKRNDLPKNMSIRIAKEGNKPAKIYVKKEDQEWEVTEDKLGDLPEEVRSHVQQFLAQPMRLSVDFKGPNIEARQFNLNKRDGKAEAEFKFTPSATANRSLSWRTERSEGAGSLDAKLDSIVKKLDQLSKEVDELRNKK